jgi:hypothetical protein
MPDGAPETHDAIAEYKALLREYIDRRPSGTRQKLAEAFGTHKSFISQITNPNYRVPLPVQHIPALFKVCRLNAQEQRTFLEVYARAHPGQYGAIEDLASVEKDVVRIPLPHFENPALREQVEQLVKDFSERVVTLVKEAERKS